MIEEVAAKNRSGNRRVYRIAGLTVLTLALIVCVIGSIAVYRNWALIDTFAFVLSDSEAAQIQPQDAEDMLVYLERYPDTTALVVYSVSEDGSIDAGREVIAHNGDLVVPLASTVKIVLLGSYAQAIVQGDIAAVETVTLAEWERFYLPGTDGGAHIAALDELGIEHVDGLAVDSTVTVTLDQLAHAMIRFSDNAATDLLFARLGAGAVARFVADAGMGDQEPFTSMSGMFLSWGNHESGVLNGERAAELLAMSPAGLQAERDHWDDKMADEMWRAEEQRWRISGSSLASLRHQYVVAQLGSGGSANDYARLMALIATDNLIATELTAIMKRHLDWPMENAPISAAYSEFGTKGGSLAGVLTEASYAVPLDGVYAAETRVVVLFMNEIPGTPFGIMAQSFAGQALMQALLTNPDMVRRTTAVLKG